MSIVIGSVERSIAEQFGVGIRILPPSTPAATYEVISPVFEARRGVSLLISQPFKNRAVAKLSFDVFGSQLIGVWRTRDDETLLSAFRYLRCFENRLHVDVKIGGSQLRPDFASCNAMKTLSSPTDFSYRVSKTTSGKITEQDLADLIQCSFGFLFMLSGVLQHKPKDALKVPRQEGGIKQTSLTYHERSGINRAICIAAKGTTCMVCGFNFASTYGSFAAGYVEIHHLFPISNMNESRIIDPIEELVPLCPNCHVAVHMEDPPIPLDKLRALIKEAAER